MYKPTRAVFILLTLALFLGACLPAAQQPEVKPVQNTPAGIIDVQSQINTSVAQTVEAQGQISTFVAQTMEAQATPVPSVTPIPTFTPFTLATVTNTPWAGGGTGGSGGGGGGGSSGPSNTGAYDCEITNTKPYDGDRIWRPGDSFDVTWTLKNVGTKKIPAGAYFTYIGGDVISGTPAFTLGYEVPLQKTFTVTIEVTVPQVSGLEKKQFTMQWALVFAGVKLCRPYIAIFVQKK